MPLEYIDELNCYDLCLESFIPVVLNSATTLISFYVSKEEKLTKKFYTSTKSIYYLQ